MNQMSTVHEEEEVDDDDMGVAETYADYMPSKCKIGNYHLMFLAHWENSVKSSLL